MSKREITLTIRSRLEDVGLARAALEGLCSSTGMSAAETYNVVLCAVEAITNSIRHAYRGEDHHRVELSVAIWEDCIRVAVLDRGEPVPPDKRRPPSLDGDDDPEALLQEGGRGIFLIHSLMDEVDFSESDGANVLTMKRCFASDS